MKLPLLIKECVWEQYLKPIKAGTNADKIYQFYMIAGLQEAGQHISEALINAKLRKPHRMRVTIQVVAEEIIE